MLVRFCSYLTAPSVLFGACALVVLLGTTGCGARESDEPPASSADTSAAAEVEYVGDAACASCHSETYAAYHRTGMGRSLGRFKKAAAPASFGDGARVYHEATDFYYEAFVRSDTLYQREFRLDEAGRVTYERVYPAAWVVGSGNATRSYIMEAGGYLTEMPLTWYVDKQKWDLSPGYEHANSRFSRPITAECMTCHNGRPQHSRFTQNHYTQVPQGITCERCHGPGSEHVDRQLAGMGPAEGQPDSTIVNPARLSRDRQLDVCQQCHLTGITVPKPGESVTSFRPGEPLAAHRAVFVTEEELEDPEQFGIASHALRLAKSACFQHSDMTCTTCHDPHQPVAEMGENHFNEACQSCHAPTADQPVCSRPGAHEIEAAMSGDCVSCHLRQGGTSDIPHVTFTDHWIRRRLPEGTGPAETSAGARQRQARDTPFELVRVTEASGETVSDEALAALEEAVAYYELYETRHPRRAYLPEVTKRARRGLAGGADLAEGRLALARALIEQDSLERAEAVLQDAAEVYPKNARVLYWLGTVRYRAGRAEAALAPLRQAQNIQPAFLEAGIKRGEALETTGQLDAAARVLGKVLRRDSVHHPEVWNNLGFIHLRKKRLDKAQAHFERALSLAPDLAVAHVNRGTVHLMRQDYEAAAAAFERATRADSSYAPAFGNLGLVYARMGRYEEARAALQRVLELNPGDQRAQAALRQLNRREQKR